MGLTEWLASRLYPQFKSVRIRSLFGKFGISRGRKVDHAIAASIKTNLPATGGAAVVLDYIRTAMKKNPSRQQVFLKKPEWGVRTWADIITQDGTVIEVKTTLQDEALHRKTYTMAHAKTARMANGLPNSEYWHHQLQLYATARMAHARLDTARVLMLCAHNRVVEYPLHDCLRSKAGDVYLRIVTPT